MFDSSDRTTATSELCNTLVIFRVIECLNVNEGITSRQGVFTERAHFYNPPQLGFQQGWTDLLITRWRYPHFNSADGPRDRKMRPSGTRHQAPGSPMRFVSTRVCWLHLAELFDGGLRSPC